jgi:hypothetical protein
MKTTHGRVRTWLITAAAVTGIALGAAGVAGAASGGSPAASTTPAASNAAPNPATMKNGPGETLLTGTTADKVKAAALTAVPGGTIIRVETDSAGSPYEAHVTKTDGTQVTVKVDAGFKVTATEAGFGGGPGGQAPPNGNANPNA